MNPIEALKMHGVGVGKKLVGDAQPGDVRVGKTFSNAQGNDKAGTLPIRSVVAQTITPGVNNIIKQAGIYDGDITIEGDPDLVGTNIVNGKSIFGVMGSFAGKRQAMGSQTFPASSGTVTITGLAFRPKFVIATFDQAGADHFYIWDATTYTLYGNNPQKFDRVDGDPVNPGTSNQTITNDGFTFTYSFSGGTVRWLAFE